VEDLVYEQLMSVRPNRFCFRAAVLSQLAALTLFAVLPVEAAEESVASFQEAPVLPGKTISGAVPLSAEEKTYAAIGGNQVPASAVAVLTVPPGFDPRERQNVLGPRIEPRASSRRTISRCSKCDGCGLCEKINRTPAAKLTQFRQRRIQKTRS